MNGIPKLCILLTTTNAVRRTTFMKNGERPYFSIAFDSNGPESKFGSPYFAIRPTDSESGCAANRLRPDFRTANSKSTIRCGYDVRRRRISRLLRGAGKVRRRCLGCLGLGVTCVDVVQQVNDTVAVSVFVVIPEKVTSRYCLHRTSEWITESRSDMIYRARDCVTAID